MEEGDCAAHGLAVEEAGQAVEAREVLNGGEEGEAILHGEVDVGDEGFEAAGVAVALEVEGEASETHLGEEDWGGLEGPGDVVAVAVDHEDDGAWWGGGCGGGEPGPGEEGEASGGGEGGF